MAGYADTRQMIIDTLVGRMAGTEIQPEDHQKFALQITDYVRSVELVAGNATPIGFADADTVPVQPDNGQAVYLSSVGGAQTVTFSNFIGQNGSPISVTSTENVIKLVTLLWNGQYWSSQVTSVNAVRDTTDGYLFMGIAYPNTDPGTPDQKVFYLTYLPGTYTNFDGLVVNEKFANLLVYDSEWRKLNTGINIRFDIDVLSFHMDKTTNTVEFSALRVHNMVGAFIINPPAGQEKFTFNLYLPDTTNVFLVLTSTNEILVKAKNESILSSDAILLNYNPILKEFYNLGYLYDAVIKAEQQELQNEVNSRFENIENAFDYSVLSPISSENGTLNADTGEIIQANGYTNKYIIEDRNKLFKVSGRIGNQPQYCMVCFYDINNNFISSLFRSTGIGQNIIDATIQIPTNASFIKVYGRDVVGFQTPILKIGAKATESILKGKKIAVIGDSISTIYQGNTPYITILPIDVGQQIQAYVTWHDVYIDRTPTSPTNKTIGGVLLTEEMIGTLQTFTPTLQDVGKTIGDARTYYTSPSDIGWHQRLCEKTGAILLANASWSGSTITTMETEARGDSFKLSEAWSDYTIGRCRVRDDEGNWINPDVIIIYRGTNDFSYANNDNYPSLSIGEDSLIGGLTAISDKVGDTYRFRLGYYLTIKKLREAYPKATIVCCTLNVFKRVTYDVFPTRNNAFTLPDMNNCIREIANTMGCGLIEFDKDGITFENLYTGGYVTDSATIPTHPANKGHKVMAQRAINDLTYILSE